MKILQSKLLSFNLLLPCWTCIAKLEFYIDGRLQVPITILDQRRRKLCHGCSTVCCKLPKGLRLLIFPQNLPHVWLQLQGSIGLNNESHLPWFRRYQLSGLSLSTSYFHITETNSSDPIFESPVKDQAIHEKLLSCKNFCKYT